VYIFLDKEGEEGKTPGIGLSIPYCFTVIHPDAYKTKYHDLHGPSRLLHELAASCLYLEHPLQHDYPKEIRLPESTHLLLQHGAVNNSIIIIIALPVLWC
jgi:hypothetical protein